MLAGPAGARTELGAGALARVGAAGGPALVAARTELGAGAAVDAGAGLAGDGRDLAVILEDRLGRDALDRADLAATHLGRAVADLVAGGAVALGHLVAALRGRGVADRLRVVAVVHVGDVHAVVDHRRVGRVDAAGVAHVRVVQVPAGVGRDQHVVQDERGERVDVPGEDASADQGVDVAGQHRVHHVVGEVVRLVVVAHPAVRVDDAHGRVLGDGLVGDRRVRSHVGVDL